MRGFLISVLLFSQVSQADTFLDRCFPNATFLKAKIECRLADENGELNFTMKQSKAILVSGSGRYSTVNKYFKVGKISHLGPRLSDVGALDESVRFLGTLGSYVVTIDIPCNQTAYGAVGMSKILDENDVPGEHIAACSVQ